MDLMTLKNAIDTGGRIVCLLGMNVSSDAGCFDYRDSDNAYAIETNYGYSPEEIFSASFYNTRPRLFFEYYHKEILNKLGEPCEAMYTLKRLEDRQKVTAVITRSIYGLPRRAGIRNYVEMHGSVYENKCPHCGEMYNIEYMKEAKGVPFCRKCGAVVRPQIVLDGEMIPNGKITQSAYEVERADTLLVLGCSLRSTLAKNAVRYFDGSRIILINEEEDYSDNIADFVFTGRPRDILPKIEN